MAVHYRPSLAPKFEFETLRPQDVGFLRLQASRLYGIRFNASGSGSRLEVLIRSIDKRLPRRLAEVVEM